MLGFQVTLTNADTNYNLLTLVRAIDANFVDQGEMFIQGSDDGGAQLFRLGGADLSDTEYGWLFGIAESAPHVKALRTTYARCDTAAKKLNIQVVR